MRDAVIVSGVLGLGCAVVFALAAMAWAVFPNGSMVSVGYWGGKVEVFGGGPLPAVDPPIIDVPDEGPEK
jgi:hypothetical protein